MRKPAAVAGSEELLDAGAEEFARPLHLRPLRECERVLDVNAQVPDGALDLRMAEQDLHGAQVARLLVDNGSLGSAQRVRPVVLTAQSNPSYPLVNEAGILPGADVIGVVNPAREDEVVERTSSAFEPCMDAATGRLEELELNRSTGLLLNDDRS